MTRTVVSRVGPVKGSSRVVGWGRGKPQTLNPRPVAYSSRPLSGRLGVEPSLILCRQQWSSRVPNPGLRRALASSYWSARALAPLRSSPPPALHFPTTSGMRIESTYVGCKILSRTLLTMKSTLRASAPFGPHTCLGLRV